MAAARLDRLSFPTPPFCVDQKVSLVEFPSLSGAYIDHRVLREDIRVFHRPGSRPPGTFVTRATSAQREERGPKVTISQVTSQ